MHETDPLGSLADQASSPIESTEPRPGPGAGKDVGEEVEFDGLDSRVTPLRVVLGLIVLATFGVWAYAYSGLADRTPPDTLDDPSFGLQAESICGDALEDIAAMPNALDARDPGERAGQIRSINLRYGQMLDDLETSFATSDGGTGLFRSERDQGIIGLWLDRWRIILDDRADYANRLELDPDALFYLSSDAGRRAERSLTYIATTNAMPSCGAPTDVG